MAVEPHRTRPPRGEPEGQNAKRHGGRPTRLSCGCGGRGDFGAGSSARRSGSRAGAASSETPLPLNARRIGLRSLTENIDTTTPGGRLIFHVFGALAAFERDLVKERTMAGLAAAAARGRQGGRRPVVTPGKLERARALLAQGLNVREAATRLKIGKTALYDALANAIR